MDIKNKIEDLIKQNDVCLFMKGVPENPQCGFSMAVSNVLKHLKINFKGINVLEDVHQDKVLRIIATGQQFPNYM